MKRQQQTREKIQLRNGNVSIEKNVESTANDMSQRMMNKKKNGTEKKINELKINEMKCL